MSNQALRILTVCLPLAGLACADTLVLRNGAHLPGRFMSGQSNGIMFNVEGGRPRRFDMNDVARIEFNRAGDPNDRFNGDTFGDDQHAKYDSYRNRPDYRDNQPQGNPIEAKYQDMSRGGVGLGQPVSAEQTSSDGQGHFRIYQNSTVYWNPRTGAHEVHGSIREQYMRMGAENSRLGYPVSDEILAPDGAGRLSTFEHGTIYWSARSGARADFTR